MLTVDKAVRLLGFFSPSNPEIGLSELARTAAIEKATARRLLLALSKHGLIEQNPESRDYRLGSALLRLALAREQTRPFKSIVQPVLQSLAAETGETAHASILSGQSLSTVAIAEPQRTTRAHVDPAEPLPLHATASGLAFLAFSDEDLIGRRPLQRFAANTIVSHKALAAELALVRKRGYARAEGSFEDDVVGTAAPIFDAAGKPAGAIAVAAVASRVNAATAAGIARQVMRQAAATTRAISGNAEN